MTEPGPATTAGRRRGRVGLLIVFVLLVGGIVGLVAAWRNARDASAARAARVAAEPDAFVSMSAMGPSLEGDAAVLVQRGLDALPDVLDEAERHPPGSAARWALLAVVWRMLPRPEGGDALDALAPEVADRIARLALDSLLAESERREMPMAAWVVLDRSKPDLGWLDEIVAAGDAETLRALLPHLESPRGRLEQIAARMPAIADALGAEAVPLMIGSLPASDRDETWRALLEHDPGLRATAAAMEADPALFRQVLMSRGTTIAYGAGRRRALALVGPLLDETGEPSRSALLTVGSGDSDERHAMRICDHALEAVRMLAGSRHDLPGVAIARRGSDAAWDEALAAAQAWWRKHRSVLDELELADEGWIEVRLNMVQTDQFRIHLAGGGYLGFQGPKLSWGPEAAGKRHLRFEDLTRGRSVEAEIEVPVDGAVFVTVDFDAGTVETSSTTTGRAPR